MGCIRCGHKLPVHRYVAILGHAPASASYEERTISETRHDCCSRRCAEKLCTAHRLTYPGRGAGITQRCAGPCSVHHTAQPYNQGVRHG